MIFQSQQKTSESPLSSSFDYQRQKLVVLEIIHSGEELVDEFITIFNNPVETAFKVFDGFFD